MLILTRRIGETIMIGDEIMVTVVRVGAHDARLAIQAPKDIPVHRKEVYERVQRERLETRRTD